MEINSLGEPVAAKSSADQNGNLLRQLKASGSIEAVVLKLLPGKLLLGSRVGEILTSNTLNLQPGDRIRVRLDDSGAQAVLKVSREKDPPVVLPASANSRLKQALPEQQLKLALVLRVAAQSTEIQLANDRFNLPQRLPVVSRDLLTLLRDDSRDRIEIRVVDKKPVYKALLQQLLPRQPRGAASESSLVRLVNLLRDAIGDRPSITPEAARGAEPAAIKGNPRAASAKNPAAARTPSTPTAAEQPPLPKRADATVGSDSADKPNLTRDAATTGPSRNTTPRPWENLLAATAAKTLARPAPKPGPMPTGQNLNTADPLPRETPKTASGSDRLQLKLLSRLPAAPVNAGVRSSITTPGGNPQAQATAGTAGPQPSPDRGFLAAQATAVTPVKPAVGPASIPESARPLPAAPQGQATRVAPSRAGTASAIPPSLPPGSPLPGPEAQAGPASALAQLVQRLPEFAAIDRANIHRWLEISGLAQARPPQTSVSTPADLTRLLPQLANGETFNRELEQLVQLRSRAGSNEDGTQRYQPVENLLASVRDGLRLVEQSLAHSLLQRASVGLQQETQQPPSLSFALPVIDQQEVKPLWIELHQRGKATSDGEQSWDVRLTFEFGDLGPVSCHVFLQGFRIAASFYSDWAATQESIESALPQLRRQLVAAGFDPGEMHSFPGNMAPAADSVAEFVESLIDIEV